MTITAICLFFIGALVVSTTLIIWFHTGFALHFVDQLRWAGIKSEWWKNYNPEEVCTKEQLDDYMVATVGAPLWLELLTCPVCLSVHLSFWISLIIWVFSPVSFLFIPIGTACWPTISNLLLNAHKE